MRVRKDGREYELACQAQIDAFLNSGWEPVDGSHPDEKPTDETGRAEASAKKTKGGAPK